MGTQVSEEPLGAVLGEDGDHLPPHAAGLAQRQPNGASLLVVLGPAQALPQAAALAAQGGRAGPFLAALAEQLGGGVGRRAHRQVLRRFQRVRPLRPMGRPSPR